MVKPYFIYVYLRWFIEIYVKLYNKGDNYLGMDIAYNNIISMYPKLGWFVNFSMKYKIKWLILFLLKLYRLLKYNLLYKISKHYKPIVVSVN